MLARQLDTKDKVNPYAPSHEAEFIKHYSNKIPIECDEWMKGSNLPRLRRPRFN